MPHSFYRCHLVLGFLVFLVLLGSTGRAQQKSELGNQPDKTAELESAGSAPATETVSKSTASLFDGNVPQTLEELRAMEDKFAEVAEIVKPATVNIQLGGGQGSGVIVTSDGYILTAAHVIGRPGGKADVTFADNRKVTATTLGIDTRLDSGMLKIDEGQGEDFPYLEIGLSNELKEGQWVMAVGHPGGLDEARGLVVRVGRILLESNRILRTDCTLVGGDSGGPLVDMEGSLIGIHSRIGSQLWNNIHVPIDVYSENWDGLKEGLVLDGRANLGFSVADSTNKIESVVEKGAADKVGIKVGDLIKKIGLLEVKDRDGIKAATKDLRPNMKVKIVVERDGVEQSFELVVGDW